MFSSRRVCAKRVGGLGCQLAVVIALICSTSERAYAQTQLDEFYNKAINGGVAADSWGARSTETTFATGTLYIQVPAGATIVQAWLLSGVKSPSDVVPAAGVDREVLLGPMATAVPLILQGNADHFVTDTVGTGEVYAAFSFDVTSTIQALLATADANGVIAVPIHERGDDNALGLPLILGHTLVVVYALPSAPLRNISIWLGAGGTDSVIGNTSLTFTLAKGVARYCSTHMPSEEPFVASATAFWQVAGTADEENGAILFNTTSLSSNVGLNDDNADALSTTAASVTGGSFGASPGAAGVAPGFPSVLAAKGDLISGVALGRLDDELYNVYSLFADNDPNVAFTYTDNHSSYLGAFIVQTLARVSATDGDGDGKLDGDLTEGCNDADNDGIFNYLDFNSAPTANNDTIRVVRGASAVVPTSTLLANDSDAQNDALTITAIGSVSAGLTAMLNANQIALTVPANGNTASFAYTVTDAQGATSTANVTIDLLSVSMTAPVDNAVITILTPAVSGATLANQAVSVAFRTNGMNDFTLSTNANALGAWSVTVPMVNALSEGAHEIIASVSDVFGNQASVTHNIVIAVTNSDGDTVPDYLDADDDNDGVPDSEEAPASVDRDTDGDGVVDRLDLDADNDGIPDVVEAGFAVFDVDHNGRVDVTTDANSDGWDDGIDTATGGVWVSDAILPRADIDALADYRDLDSDADGITDAFEAGLGMLDADSDGRVDNVGVVGMDTDVNNDGWHDSASALATVANLPNSDATLLGSDMIADYREVDADDDHVPDAVEGHDTDHNGEADVLATNVDTDGDGLDNAFDPNNGMVLANGMPASLPDTDNDGRLDYRDMDDDADTVFTKFEDSARDGSSDPRVNDTDADGTPNYLDIDDDNDGTRTSGELPDPNGDGNPADASNLNRNDNPDVPDYLDSTTAPTDSDFDGIADVLEQMLGTNPKDADTDNDGVCDGQISRDKLCVAGENAQARQDTDGDTVIDALDADDENDGNLSRDEDLNKNGNPLDDDSDGDGVSNYLDVDDDGDGLLTRDEIGDSAKVGTSDLDFDGVPTWLDTDSDGDRISDGVEGRVTDSDHDGFSDYLDSLLGGPAGGAMHKCALSPTNKRMSLIELGSVLLLMAWLFARRARRLT